jgi:hypothetical protein
VRQNQKEPHPWFTGIYPYIPYLVIAFIVFVFGIIVAMLVAPREALGSVLLSFAEHFVSKR